MQLLCDKYNYIILYVYYGLSHSPLKYPHVVCWFCDDRRSLRARAATLRFGWSCIHFGIEWYAASRFSRSPYHPTIAHGRHLALLTFTDPRNPL